ncbi:polysaccharide deacetylase family protein [Anaerosporobacter faecicola]|uniref:polysaccharide deacetylase family protein n=1 Tax=Anaerosporobacter faecicola TaxID=2718714 RepID=UPI001438740E|nr:polysaccharide deacetylase family protein [Anaerosporobacter faecicola]
MGKKKVHRIIFCLLCILLVTGLSGCKKNTMVENSFQNQSSSSTKENGQMQEEEQKKEGEHKQEEEQKQKEEQKLDKEQKLDDEQEQDHQESELEQTKESNEEKNQTKQKQEEQNEQNEQEYESYTGEIPHIFIHALIANPEIKDSNGLMRYDADCITVKEFENLLEELYNNGYSLIDINKTFYTTKKGKMKTAKSIQVPKGRKPLIFSVDDVVYDVKKRGNGMVDFLAIDEKKQIVSGTYQEDGSVLYSSENEFVPILEKFIEKHPEFSTNGARMTLCMTGFTGVFGYRTDRNYEGDREEEIKKAKKVANRLKELGYTFACHSYGHYDCTKHTKKSLKTDLQHFQEEVKPIIGDTTIFVYPYGKLIKPEDERYQVLLDYDYRVFCSVSNFFYLRDYEEGHSIYMTRVAIDGYSLRNYKTVLAPVIDVDHVIER